MATIAPLHDEKAPEKTATPPTRKKRANMHEGIAVWADCCSCEMEPYWAEVAEEMGMRFSDYEDEEPPKP